MHIESKVNRDQIHTQTEIMKVILTLIALVLGENIVVSHHDISATVQMVGGIACSVPSFPFAKNIDCTGPLKPGTHCDHQCGDVHDDERQIP